MIDATRWNRIRYGAVAPVYDAGMALLDVAGFGAARRRALELLAPRPGERLLILGAGTGADLDHIPEGVEVMATDLSPGMVRRTGQRAERLRRSIEARVMDASDLDFESGSFDCVVLHLILAVMPAPEACAAEVRRVLRPGGRVSVFDKFVPDGGTPSLARRAANLLARPAFTDLNRQLGPILAAGGLRVVHREPALGGLFTVALAATESE